MTGLTTESLLATFNMTQIFLGDFETGDASQFTSSSGAVVSTPTVAGGYAGRNSDNNNFRKVLASALSTIYVHGFFRWSVDVSSASNWFVLLLDSDSATQLVVRLLNGKLTYEVAGNSTTYTGIKNLLPNIWYEIEVKFIMHDTTGSFEVRINGGVDKAVSSIDTKSGADTGIKAIKWHGINAAGYCYIDNASVNDSTWERKNFVMRVSLAGYNALTDTNPDHYSLYTDEDWILIKEFVRGTTTVTYNTTTEITHNLGYIPFVSVWYQDELDTNQWNLVSGIGKNNVYIEITTTKLKLINHSIWAVNIPYRYYIFYDNFS